MTKKMVAGGMMMGLGILMLAANAGLVSGLWVLYGASAGLLVAYWGFDRHMGFLIPGLIVGGLASFATFDQITGGISGGYLFFFFAGAFYLVYGLHTRQLESADQGEKIWPLFPGTALLAVGLLVLGIENSVFGEASLRSFALAAPVGLILTGLVIFAKNVRSGSSQ